MVIKKKKKKTEEENNKKNVKERRNSKNQNSNKSLSRQSSNASTIKSPKSSNIKTLDEDWPYNNDDDPSTAPIPFRPLPMPSFASISLLINNVRSLTKVILNGLNKNERNAYLHHHTSDITHFMSGAAALHRSNEKGLVQKISRGNYRVAVELSPDQEILMLKMLEKSGLQNRHANLSKKLQETMHKKSIEAKQSVNTEKTVPEFEKTTNELWFDDNQDEDEEVLKHMSTEKERLTTEVADRSQLKKLSQMLVHRKQKNKLKNGDDGASSSPVKKKQKKKKVTIGNENVSERQNVKKKKKKNSKIATRRGTTFLTQSDGKYADNKIGHGKYGMLKDHPTIVLSFRKYLSH